MLLPTFRKLIFYFMWYNIKTKQKPNNNQPTKQKKQKQNKNKQQPPKNPQQQTNKYNNKQTHYKTHTHKIK